MTFEKGALVLVDYTATVEDSGELVETTIEEVAQKHDWDNLDAQYEPRLVAIGHSWVLKGLDEALANAGVGEKISITVAPDKAFGERDSGKVRMIPLRKLGDDADKVSIGDTIDLDNKKGIIRYIGSGRVQIDFNHKYAGKTIIYDANVLKFFEADDDKIHALLKRDLPVDESKIQFTRTEDALDVVIPEELFKVDGIQIIKNLTQRDLFQFVPSLQKINFIETFTNKNAPSV